MTQWPFSFCSFTILLAIVLGLNSSILPTAPIFPKKPVFQNFISTKVWAPASVWQHFTLYYYKCKYIIQENSFCVNAFQVIVNPTKQR